MMALGPTDPRRNGDSSRDRDASGSWTALGASEGIVGRVWLTKWDVWLYEGLGRGDIDAVLLSIDMLKFWA